MPAEEFYRGHHISATLRPEGGWTARIDLHPVGVAVSAEAALDQARAEIDRCYQAQPPPRLRVVDRRE